MRILGLDPGISFTGYGIVDCYQGHYALVDAGIISTTENAGARKGDDAARRCAEIAEGLAALIETHQPDQAALEGMVNFGQHTKIPRWAYVQQGRVMGEIANVLRRYGLAPAEYPTQTVKTVVACSRKATKSMVQAFVQRRLGQARPIRPKHASDALAVALCHAAKQPMAQLRKPAQEKGADR